MVCPEDWEMRHAQDFLRVQKEKINVEFSRPYPAQDNFITYICSVSGRYGMADIGTADCAQADFYSPQAIYDAQAENPLTAY